MSNTTITAQQITIEGKPFTVNAWTYDSTTDAVTASITTASGERTAVTFTITDECYPAALIAATTANIKPAAQEPTAPSADKMAHGPVPEKTWIGEEIVGRGWKIAFDKTFEKTRVIFDRVPTQEAREAVKAAGFYFNPATGSWNKGLTWKAYRAAQALAGVLGNMVAVPARRR